LRCPRYSTVISSSRDEHGAERGEVAGAGGAAERLGGGAVEVEVADAAAGVDELAGAHHAPARADVDGVRAALAVEDDRDVGLRRREHVRDRAAGAAGGDRRGAGRAGAVDREDDGPCAVGELLEEQPGAIAARRQHARREGAGDDRRRRRGGVTELLGEHDLLDDPAALAAGVLVDPDAGPALRRGERAHRGRAVAALEALAHAGERQLARERSAHRLPQHLLLVRQGESHDQRVNHRSHSC
jgi:hypothetical protein